MAKNTIREWLNTQKKDVLVSIIVEQAEDDERLFRQLSLKAARSKPCNVEAYRAALEAYDYASGIDDIVDSIEELLDDNRALEVVKLVNYALNTVERALNYVDDSSGSIGGILDRLQNIHLEACKKAKVDPQELVTQFFKRELRTDFDTLLWSNEDLCKYSW